MVHQIIALTSSDSLSKTTLRGPLAQLVEQLTFNQWVAGSNPARLTTEVYKILSHAFGSKFPRVSVIKWFETDGILTLKSYRSSGFS